MPTYVTHSAQMAVRYAGGFVGWSLRVVRERSRGYVAGCCKLSGGGDCFGLPDYGLDYAGHSGFDCPGFDCPPGSIAVPRPGSAIQSA